MEIRICDLCKATNIKTLLPTLKENFPEAIVKIGCQNMCGIGATKNFAIVDHIPVIAENEKELIDKIKAIKK